MISEGKIHLKTVPCIKTDLYSTSLLQQVFITAYKIGVITDTYCRQFRTWKYVNYSKNQSVNIFGCLIANENVGVKEVIVLL